jgi:hypothetical protein
LPGTEQALPYYDIIWDTEPGGNAEHIAENGLTLDDIRAALFNPVGHKVSDSSG